MKKNILNYTTLVNLPSPKITILFVALLLSPCQLRAQNTLTSLPFLRIEPDARVSAMAGSGVTQVDEGFGGYYNPASLGWKKQGSIGLSYSNWLAGLGTNLQYNRLAGTFKFKKSALALSVSYFNFGKQTATDASNNVIASFTNYQAASGLSYGRQMTKRLALGLGIKHIYSSLGAGLVVEGKNVDPAWTYAGDIGFLWQTGTFSVMGGDGRFRFASSLSHFGPGISYLDEGEKTALPQTFRFGMGITRSSGQDKDHVFSLTADAIHLLARLESKVVNGDTTWSSLPPLDALLKGWGPMQRIEGNKVIELSLIDQLGLSVGTEYVFRDLFALRGGYFTEHPSNGNRQFITLGAGFKVYQVNMDFSYLHSLEANHPMDGTLRASLLFTLK